MCTAAHKHRSIQWLVGLLMLILVAQLVCQPGNQGAQPQQGSVRELSMMPRATAALQSHPLLIDDSISVKHELLANRQEEITEQTNSKLAMSHPLLRSMPLAFYMLFFLLPVFNSKYK